MVVLNFFSGLSIIFQQRGKIKWYDVWQRNIYIPILLLSCHQTAFFHLSTHFLAFSLNFWRSSKVQGCASNGYCNICLVVSGAWPHSHVVSPLKYFHLLRCSLMHATPVRNLLRHLHAAHGQLYRMTFLCYNLKNISRNHNLCIKLFL